MWCTLVNLHKSKRASQIMTVLRPADTLYCWGSIGDSLGPLVICFSFSGDGVDTNWYVLTFAIYDYGFLLDVIIATINYIYKIVHDNFWGFDKTGIANIS